MQGEGLEYTFSVCPYSSGSQWELVCDPHKNKNSGSNKSKDKAKKNDGNDRMVQNRMLHIEYVGKYIRMKNQGKNWNQDEIVLVTSIDKHGCFCCQREGGKGHFTADPNSEGSQWFFVKRQRRCAVAPTSSKRFAGASSVGHA